MKGDSPGEARLADADGLEVLVWSGLGDLGVDAIVTTRDGGVSTGPYRSLNLALHVGDDPTAVIENRKRATGALGASVTDLVVAEQVHGATTAVVGTSDRGRGALGQADAPAATDALATATPGVVLATLVADCVPLLLVDPGAAVIATVHAGWRGTLAGVAGAALRAMGRLGARPETTLACIGPAASPTTYEVGPEVAARFRRVLGTGAEAVLAPGRADRVLLDLVGANRQLLVAAGVAPGSVHRCPLSTADGRFFSDRRERPCGRFALLARLRP